MIQIRHELDSDSVQREALLDRTFGKQRRRKTSERLREGRLPSDGLAFTAVNDKGKVVGTVRLWDIVAGSAGPALLLGPLAVDARHRGQGLGAMLMERAVNEAKVKGFGAVLLVGDALYYGRFGFTAGAVADLRLPGPVEKARFLGLELLPGGLDGAEGLVAASGRMEAERRRVA
jgi:predicted N-acetyltransferase YhbS